ncbi:MAG: hypothetical protein HC825_12425 [Oscillatoriales cyanobacterium RM1_1_9]|nr:hypothetical protein [Oscillatoriales cyanobacterium SM2_3_0]NJO46134.1 hypothetical protein [Oscillatoriales cyanobacterium RM2_1_1]NJO72259.1 hypothetical protein [Oscillatoriales cyanobacterium RM1_1_9]
MANRRDTAAQKAGVTTTLGHGMILQLTFQVLLRQDQIFPVFMHPIQD